MCICQPSGITLLTAKLIPVRRTSHHSNGFGTSVPSSWREVRFTETKTNAIRADPTAEAGECCESVRTNAMLDEFTTYQVDGSIVDYHADDG